MEYLGVLKSGEQVYNRDSTHVDKVIKDLVLGVLPSIESNDEVHFEKSITFPNNIGICRVVRATFNDQIYYAVRKNRKGYSRIVKGKEGEQSNILFLVLHKYPEDGTKYVLITAYIGDRAGPEPYDKYCMPSDKEYWLNNAFVEELVEIDNNTITNIPPSYWSNI